MKLSTEPITNWVLVTGMIRSGTTFVGKILSLPLQVDYIHEPFNSGYTIPGGNPFPPRYLRYDASGTEANSYHELLAHIFRYDFGLKTQWDEHDPWWRKAAKMCIGSRGPFYLRLAKLNPFHHSAVIKDPLAMRPAEYLYYHFDVHPVIVVRHPASLAASLKRVGWWPEIEKGFMQNPDLLHDYFADDDEFLNRNWPSRFLESMGFWRCAYKMLLTQANKYSDWIVVTHEELSAQPVPTFQRLYDRLNLPWSSRIESAIQRLTGRSNTTEARHGQAMDLSRNSANIFEMRRDSLTLDERRAIFDIVKDVSLQLYSRESFDID